MVAVQLKMSAEMAKKEIIGVPSVILRDAMSKNVWYSMMIQGIISNELIGTSAEQLKDYLLLSLRSVLQLEPSSCVCVW